RGAARDPPGAPARWRARDRDRESDRDLVLPRPPGSQLSTVHRAPAAAGSKLGHALAARPSLRHLHLHPSWLPAVARRRRLRPLENSAPGLELQLTRILDAARRGAAG